MDSRVLLETQCGESLLLCPRCGEGYLHHGQITIWERTKGEDGDGFQITVDSWREIAMEAVEEKRIPGRRNAVDIEFSCELCGDFEYEPSRTITLRIQQHKGNTVMEWFVTPRREEGTR